MDAEARMPLMGHLEELRSRILRSLLWMALALVPAWVFRLELLEFVLGPLKVVMASRGISRMVALDAGDTFLVHLLLAALAGGVLAAPLVLREVFAFVAPALSSPMRRRLWPVLLLMPLLAVVGFLFAHRVVLPFMLDFFIDFSQAGDTNLLLGIRGVFSTAVMTLLVFSLVFQLPLLMMALGAVGVVRPALWFKGFRFMIPGSLIIGGILTPPDVFSQLLLAVPILALYLLGAVMARAAGSRGMAPVAALSALLLLPAVPLLLLPGPAAPVSSRLPAGSELVARLPLDAQAVGLAQRLFPGVPVAPGQGYLWVARRDTQVLGVLEGLKGARCPAGPAPCLELEGRVLGGSPELVAAYEARARTLRSPLMPFFLGELAPGIGGALPGGQGWTLGEREGTLELVFGGVGDCGAARRLMGAEADPRTALLLALARQLETMRAQEDPAAAAELADFRRSLETPGGARLPAALVEALGGLVDCKVQDGLARLRPAATVATAQALEAVLW